MPSFARELETTLHNALAAASTRRLSDGLRAVVTTLYASAGTRITRPMTVSMGGVASKL